MKKLSSFILLSIVFFAIVSCVGGKEPDAKEKLKSFGNNIVEKVAANQIDSLSKIYPGIVNADSLRVLSGSDSIIVTVDSLTDNAFTISIGPDVVLNLKVNEKGDTTVVSSKGLFLFPAERIKMAEQTGVLVDSPNDVELLQRLNDEEFQSFLDMKTKSASSNILSVKRGNSISYIINNTDQPILATDYAIIVSEGSVSGFGIGGGYSQNYTIKGKPIEPHGKVAIKTNSEGMVWDNQLEGIKMKLSQKEMAERFAKFSGKEYQEYLDSKKQK